MQLAQSSCTTQARKCIDRYRIPEHTRHGFQGGQPSLNPVMGCHPGPPPSLPTPPAPTNHSTPCMAIGQKACSAQRRMAAMQPGRGLGPVAQRTPAALKYGTCSTEISGGNSGRRMLSFWFVVVRQPQTHPDSRRPNVKSSTGNVFQNTGTANLQSWAVGFSPSHHWAHQIRSWRDISGFKPVSHPSDAHRDTFIPVISPAPTPS